MKINILYLIIAVLLVAISVLLYSQSSQNVSSKGGSAVEDIVKEETFSEDGYLTLGNRFSYQSEDPSSVYAIGTYSDRPNLLYKGTVYSDAEYTKKVATFLMGKEEAFISTEESRNQFHGKKQEINGYQVHFRRTPSQMPSSSEYRFTAFIEVDKDRRLEVLVPFSDVYEYTHFSSEQDALAYIESILESIEFKNSFFKF